ncbi:MAG: nitrite reductase small subunit NirD [Pseudomonadales bacterium]|nr:nitrite reductase small subunit NirD [Pseudomonadales bacterium]
MNWTTVCKLDDIIPGGGCCALIDNKQVAIFRIADASGDKIFALSNFDPFSKANVISRGITGSLQGKICVASPVYKQHFCLETGQCLEDKSVCLQTWPVNLSGNDVQLSSQAAVAA